MMLRACILLTVLCVVAAKKNETCFKELGCFSLESPWIDDIFRPVPIPEDPKGMGLSLEFYSKPFKNKVHKVNVYPKVDLNFAPFRADRERTIFLLAGLGQFGDWAQSQKDAFLGRLDANIFLVNTSHAFRGLDLFRAVSNSRVVGAVVANAVIHLKEKEGLDPNKVYMVGLGLGAQVAAYASQIIKVGRITALDPTQELFEDFPEYIRLDANDAGFVDVLHSDTRPVLPDFGFGYMDPMGTIDFYLNGGHGQPGCNLPRPYNVKTDGSFPDTIREVTRLIVSSISCGHRRAYQVFLEAIREPRCTFWGHGGTRENFLRSISNAGSQGILNRFTALNAPCSNQNCVPLGLETEKTKLRGIFIITTAGEKPFCLSQSHNVGQAIFKNGKQDLSRWVNGFIGKNKKDFE